MNMNILRIGHRGSKGYVAENTLESINHAILLGVDGIEIDVFKCLSGELVLSHENNLKRLTGKSGQLEKLTLGELKKFLVVGKYKIPTLTDVLKTIETPLFVNIELKGLNTAQATSKIITNLSKSTSWRLENFIISSFNWNELEIIYDLDKDIQTAVLVEERPVEMAINQAKKINAKAINIDFKLLNKKIVKKIKSENLIINAWTVNEINQIERMINLGVDGIITDFPDRVIN